MDRREGEIENGSKQELSDLRSPLGGESLALEMARNRREPAPETSEEPETRPRKKGEFHASPVSTFDEQAETLRNNPKGAAVAVALLEATEKNVREAEAAANSITGRISSFFSGRQFDPEEHRWATVEDISSCLGREIGAGELNKVMSFAPTNTLASRQLASSTDWKEREYQLTDWWVENVDRYRKDS